MKENNIIKDLCIVIPIYKEHIDTYDKLSLSQLIKVTKFKYDIIFVRPNKEFNMKEYYDVLPGWETHVFEHPYDARYFNSTETYSELLRSNMFYLTYYKQYKYILIYQLDCILLKDDIEQWMSYGYDYIGAPIVGTGSGWRAIPFVGNGGFSLRKVDTFVKLSSKEWLYENKNDIDKAINRNNDYIKYEDLYWAELISDIYASFKKPNFKIASMFAWDRNPDVLYMMNNGKLPTGIHAYTKFENFYKEIGLINKL